LQSWCKALPAPRGPGRFGGPKAPTSPYGHILHTYQVWQVGAILIREQGAVTL
jgi:hypothetical protein